MNNLGAIFSFFNVQTAQFNLQTWQIEILINSYLYVAFWSNQFVNFFLPFLDPIAGTSQTQNPKSKLDTIMIHSIILFLINFLRGNTLFVTFSSFGITSEVDVASSLLASGWAMLKVLSSVLMLTICVTWPDKIRKNAGIAETCLQHGSAILCQERSEQRLYHGHLFRKDELYSHTWCISNTCETKYHISLSPNHHALVHIDNVITSFGLLCSSGKKCFAFKCHHDTRGDQEKSHAAKSTYSSNTNIVDLPSTIHIKVWPFLASRI